MNPYVIPGRPDIDTIVATEWNIDRELLFKRTRRREIVEARQMAMFVRRTVFGETLSQASERYGLHHCSTLWSVTQVQNLMETDIHFGKKAKRTIRCVDMFAKAIREKENNTDPEAVVKNISHLDAYK